MKKLLVSSILIFVLMISFMAIVSALPNSGVIWTTRDNCGENPQNENHFFVGEKVYINGENFAAGTYNWTITGLPSSCDDGIVVASGNYVVDSSGAFCFEAYTVNLDDCKEYQADFNGKHDNYHVNPSVPVVPEFGLIVGLLTMLGAVGAFFVIRRK